MLEPTVDAGADDGGECWPWIKRLALEIMGWPLLTTFADVAAHNVETPDAGIAVEIPDVVPSASVNGYEWLPAGSLADAWLIVERLGQLGWTIHLEWKGSSREYAHSAQVSFVHHERLSSHIPGYGTAPEAICRAALEVLDLHGVSWCKEAGRG